MANRLVEIIDITGAKKPDHEAYRFCWRKDGDWMSTTWSEFASQVKVAARALCAMGLLEKDTIAICSPNTPQILITEFGAFRNRIACIPIYSSSVQSQFDYIVRDGGAKVLFVGDKHQYPMAYNHWKSNPEIKKIVIFKNDGLELVDDDTVSIFWDDFVRLGMEVPDEVEETVNQRMQRGLPEDMATLIYTSGTTGEPKGVVITHSNYDATISEHKKLLSSSIRDTDISMAFLPMSHILEKAWCFFCLSTGIAIAVNYDPRVISDTIHDVHPNLMCCVPRFWEKVYAGVREKLEEMTRMQRLMVARALRIGKARNLKYRRTGRKVPWRIEKEYKLWDRLLFSRMKKAVGIPDPNFYPTAGAPLSGKICEFFIAMGIDIIIGYGLSETTATVSCFPKVGYEIGTVGKPLPGIKVKIDSNGEILVKGPTVTPGYYNNPDANQSAFTEDGYFRTGDAGYITDDGAIVLTERVKDLFKTSNGKYIAPQMMESRLAENKYIDEVAVIGDQRKFVTALVVPNLSQLRAWAQSKGIPIDDTVKLMKNPQVIEFIMKQIETYQKDIASYEKIKRITLLPNHFSIMNGEVTNTMKVRRPIVARNYADIIEKMYADT